MQLNLISHLIWTDLRRNRSLLLFWIGLLGVLFACFWPFLAMSTPQLDEMANTGQMPMREAFTAMGAVAVCSLWAGFLILPGILLEHPSSVSTTFWLTRPIGVGNLLAAKAIVLGFFLVLLPSVADGTLTMVIAHEPWGESLSVTLQEMEICLRQVVFLSALCSLTRRRSQFIKWAFTAYILQIIWNMLLLGRWHQLLLPVWRFDFHMGSFSSKLIPASILVTVGFFGVILHQYYTRKTRTSLVLFVALFLLGPIVTLGQ
ncbi:MAG: hypothetical protein WCH57_06800 [Verrucomicrobiota bacterium]